MSEIENQAALLKVRDTAWAKQFAARLAAANVGPNAISAASVGFAAPPAGGLAAAWYLASEAPMDTFTLLLVLAAACIQARLLCNLFDGMVAVEHGRSSPTGGIWNELPDRFADALLLAGAGYGLIGQGWTVGQGLGWTAAVLAVITAYVRELGRGLGMSRRLLRPHGQTAPHGHPDRDLSDLGGRSCVGRGGAGSVAGADDHHRGHGLDRGAPGAKSRRLAEGEGLTEPDRA